MRVVKSKFRTTVIRSYMITYNEMTDKKIPSGFIKLPNYNPNRPDLYEVEPILSFITRSNINDNDYYGFFSPKVCEKTGLSATEILSIKTESIAKHDIISISPFPITMQHFLNPIVHADTAHGDFGWRFKYFASTIDTNHQLNLGDYTDGSVEHRYFLLSHFFWAKGSFWKTWATYVNRVLETESNDESYRNAIRAPCKYLSKNSDYTYLIFMLERLAGLLAFSGNLTVHQHKLKRRWLFELESHKKKPLMLIKVVKIIYGIEFFFLGEQRPPKFSHLFFRTLASIWHTIDSIAVTLLKTR